MNKKFLRGFLLVSLAVLVCCVPAMAAGTGDVAGAVEQTWKDAAAQIKTVVNNVVFPALDMILAIAFFGKVAMCYFDYRKHGQFEWTGPAILFACLVFTLTAPTYIWTIIGIRGAAMTFFENELRKILIPQYPETTFVGRAAYVRLSDANRAKIQFVSTNIASHYDALRLTILNREEGDVDNLLLRFSDLLDKKMVSNPNFRDGVEPHAWTYNGKTEWYAYHPNSHDYQKLADEVNKYLEVFQEQAYSSTPQWSQTMQ